MIISWACKWIGCGRRNRAELEAYGPAAVECDKCKRATRLMVAKRTDGKAVVIESRPLPEN